MDDYELSKDDFALIDSVFRFFIDSLRPATVEIMDARELRERFANAHTAKIIYE